MTRNAQGQIMMLLGRYAERRDADLLAETLQRHQIDAKVLLNARISQETFDVFVPPDDRTEALAIVDSFDSQATNLVDPRRLAEPEGPSRTWSLLIINSIGLLAAILSIARSGPVLSQAFWAYVLAAGVATLAIYVQNREGPGR